MSLKDVKARYPHHRARIQPEVSPDAPIGDQAPFKHLYLPLALLVLGLAARPMLIVAFHGNHPLIAAVGMDILAVVLTCGAMMAGAYLAASLMDIDFGSLTRTAIKLCAIWVCSADLAILVAALDQ